MRAGLRRALSAARAAPVAAGETWQELNVCPRSGVCARLPSPARLPRSPPPSPVRAPRAPRPDAAEAAFQELSRNPPHVTAAPASALKRLRRECASFREAGSARSVRGWGGVAAWESVRLRPYSSDYSEALTSSAPATALPASAAGACPPPCPLCAGV